MRVASKNAKSKSEKRTKRAKRPLSDREKKLSAYVSLSVLRRQSVFARWNGSMLSV